MLQRFKDGSTQRKLTLAWKWCYTPSSTTTSATKNSSPFSSCCFL